MWFLVIFNPWVFIGRTVLKLKLQYFGHWMWRADSLGKKPWCWERLRAGREGEGARQRIRWLDSITDSLDMNLSKLQEREDRGAWCPAIHGVAKRHNLATEQQQWRAKCKAREKERIIHGGCESRKTGHWIKENPWQKLRSWKEYHSEITGNSNRSWFTPNNSILFFWLALLCLFPSFQHGVLHTFSKTLDKEELHSSDVTETILSILFSKIEKASVPAKRNSSHMFTQPRPFCS